jgi:hypothetical protein
MGSKVQQLLGPHTAAISEHCHTELLASSPLQIAMLHRDRIIILSLNVILLCSNTLNPESNAVNVTDIILSAVS